MNGKQITGMGSGRREFCQSVLTASASLLAPAVSVAADATEAECDRQLAVLVDTTICIGCRKCEWACNQENRLSHRPREDFEDKSVYSRHRRPEWDAFTVVNEFADPHKSDKKYTMKIQCMHCLKPACVSACIVGALTKDRQGPVVYDAWKCIGCRYCLIACPFQIPAYEYHNAVDPQVRKCTFCIKRIKQTGGVPACVEICPNEALTFGTRAELLDAARVRINGAPDRYADHVYGEHEAGGTGWLYIGPLDFKYTELPILGSGPIPEFTESIQHGIFKSFVPPLALYGLLGLIMHAVRNGGSDQETNHGH
ncbi:MAG TPA: 4Fe-4S dicluster domain-containing protein [Candidatus Deferrimicrobium sp.]|nr:4Fe-4S dicluster domain-containing protein [Candidatus Deferrimicrobium sp.]